MIEIYGSNDRLKCQVEAGSSSQQDKALQSDNVLSLSFTHYAFLELDVNDWCEFAGERYWLQEKYLPKQKNEHEWEYNVKLYGIESLIKRLLVLQNSDGENEAVFTLTAPASEHVRLIVESINSGMGGTTNWKVGDVVATENLTIDYDGTYCDEGLRLVAEAAGTEWWIEGETVNLCRCEQGAELPLRYGESLLSLDRDEADGVKFYTRLFPIGSSRNIDRSKYGSTRLQLPGGAKYVDIPDLVERYGVFHHYEQEAFSGIYPRRVGVISSVRWEEVKDPDGNLFTIWYFKDNDLTFDPNDYEIADLVKHVSFQSGELEGRDFEVNFNSQTHEFEIITTWPYDDEMQLPDAHGGHLVPAPGNTYILWNIRMPDEYYDLAEKEYQSAVEAFNREHLLDKSVYKAPANPKWVERSGAQLYVGRRVRLESQKYFPKLGYRSSRITRLTRKVSDPYQIDLEISDAISTGTMTKIEDSIHDVKMYVRESSSVLPDIIRSWDETKPTDNNLFSARKSEREFLSKRKADTAQKKITFKEGADFGEFNEGATGAALYEDADGNWHCEADFLHARKKLTAKEVQVEEVHHVGGQQLSTAASMTCDFVVEREEGWRCFFRKTDSTGRCVLNKWKRGDQAYVCTFNLVRQSASVIGNHYLWRLVTGTSNETADDSDYVVGGETVNGGDYHFIDLSMTDFGIGSDAPQAGDDIVQLGYRPNDDEGRRNAILIAGAGTGSPYIREYTGIKDYNLPVPETQLKPGDNKLTGQVRMTAGSTLPDGTDIETAVDKTALENAIDELKDDVGGLNEDVGKLENDVVNIGNDIDGLSGDVDRLGSGLDSLADDVNNLTTGNENLLRNSGFTGDYIDESVESNTDVSEDTEMYSSPLAHWKAANADVVDTAASVTGKAIVLTTGSLSQTLDEGLEVGETYIFSFRGKGAVLTFSVGGYSKTITLAGVLTRYNVAFEASSAERVFTISDATCTLMELQLIHGQIPNTDWINSPKDNDKTLAYYQNLVYIANAIANGSTSVLGGLIMSQMLRVGNYRDGKMITETGGMSGVYADGGSPFLWGGGTMEQAFYTIAKYAEDPNYEATDDELKNLMAQFVVTHGGRAILNDIIARGTILATAGIFRNISTPNGNFSIDALGNMACNNAKISGNMFTPLTIINEDNFDYYVDSLDVEADSTNYFTWRSGGTSSANQAKATVSTDAETGDISVTINNNSSGGRFGMLVSGLPVGIYKIEFDVSQELLGGSFYTNYSNSTDGSGVAYTAEGSSIALAHHYVDGHYYLYIEKKTSGTFYIAYAVASQSPNAVGTVINITNFRVTKRKQGRSFGQYDNYAINLSRTGLNVQLDFMPADAVIELPHDDAFVGAHFRLYNNTFAEAVYAHFVCRISYDETGVRTYERTHLLGHAYAGNYVELLCFNDTTVEEGSTEWRQKWVEIARAGNEPQYVPVELTETNN